MSKLSTIQDIPTSEYVPLNPENIVARELNGFTCPQCDGRGYTLVENAHGGMEKCQCERCMGYGRLKARITVEWVVDVS